MNKVPNLRFNEFSGEWESLKISETLKIKHGRDQKKIQVEDGIYPILATGGEIGRTNIPLYDKESVLIGRKGTIDKPIYMNSPFWTVDTLFYSEIKNNMVPKFIFYKFQNINWRKYCEASGVPSLSASTIEGIRYNVPQKQEQEKIASFFSLIDKKIELQTEKVEELKNYKKGIMQKIFSQELRFKDENGNEYPEWEEKKLGEIGYFKTSSVDKNINENEELVYLVNYMDVYRHIDITKDTVIELMKVSAKENQIENNNLIKGDILFTPSSETPEDIGHSIVIFEDLHKTLYSYHLVRFRPAINLDLLYSHYFCNIDSVRSQIVKFATGSTRFTVSINEFSQVKVNLPSYDEQKKIGLFLNNIDTKIKKEQEKLEYLIEYKKGLLQQMFI